MHVCPSPRVHTPAHTPSPGSFTPPPAPLPHAAHTQSPQLSTLDLPSGSQKLSGSISPESNRLTLPEVPSGTHHGCSQPVSGRGVAPDVTRRAVNRC